MSLEGELRLSLRLQAQRCVAVDLVSTRPDVAQHLLQGRSSREALAAVPLLFSVCARSQAVAAQGALVAALQARAEGVAAEPDTSSAWGLPQALTALTAELMRESACQMLLQGPGWIGEQPAAAELQAARAFNRHLAAASAAAMTPAAAGPDQAPAPPPAGAALPADARQRLATETETALFGMPARDFMALQDRRDLEHWLADSPTLAARLLRRLRDQETPPQQTLPRLLPPAPDAALRLAWAAAMVDDPGFCRRPHWQGQPAETGALARQQAHPLVADWLAQHPGRSTARLLARLVELAAALAGRWQPNGGCLQLAPGQGLAWVDNARGLLMHRVHLRPDAAQGRVLLWRILAPTEWNFHPQGALARSLLGAPVADASTARQDALRLVQSLDPCVACHVETHDA